MHIVFSILSDPLIPYERRKPFANLLGYVYLLTERNSLVAIATLVEKVAFWKHVESCSVLMTAIKDTLHESDKKEQIRIQVKALMTQFISVLVSHTDLLNFNYVVIRHGSP